MDGLATTEVVELVRPSRGGIRTHVLGLVAGLDRAHFRPVVAGDLGLSPEERAWLLALGAEVVDLEIPSGPGPALVAAVARVRGTLARHPCAILHCHGLAAALAGRLAVQDGRPVVVTAHNLPGGPGLRSALVRMLEARLGRRTSRYIAVSQAVRDGLIAQGVPPEVIALIPPGVDTDRFRPPTPDERGAARRTLRLPPEGPIVGFLGRLAPEKGPDLLLSALAGLPEPPYLAVAGEGPMEAALRAQAVRLGLVPRVRFLGRLSDPRPFLWAVDLLAAPSRREGLGLSALEALACGRPVVGFRSGGLVEAVRPGWDGLLVPAGDVALLGRAVARLSQDEVLRRRMANEGRRRVASSFSLRESVRLIGEVYAALLDGPARPGGAGQRTGRSLSRAHRD